MPIDNASIEKIKAQLFADPDCPVFTVLDGASVPKLLEKLAKYQAESVCLYRGELEPELAEVAPYLVLLPPASELAQWVIEAAGDHWGIFAVADADTELRHLRMHFRKFLMVYSPEGKPLYFRYYDPRVFRTYLPTCNAEERSQIFGPVEKYFVEGETAGELLCFYAAEDGAQEHKV